MENATEAVAVEQEEVKAKKRGPKAKAKATKKGKKETAKVSKKAVKRTKKAKRMTEDELKNKYPHFVVGSLKFSEEDQKMRCTIKCTEKGCKKTRSVWTSDLFQVKRCAECTKEHRNEQRKKK